MTWCWILRSSHGNRLLIFHQLPPHFQLFLHQFSIPSSPCIQQELKNLKGLQRQKGPIYVLQSSDISSILSLIYWPEFLNLSIISKVNSHKRPKQNSQQQPDSWEDISIIVCAVFIPNLHEAIPHICSGQQTCHHQVLDWIQRRSIHWLWLLKNSL